MQLTQSQKTTLAVAGLSAGVLLNPVGFLRVIAVAAGSWAIASFIDESRRGHCAKKPSDA